MCQIAIGLNSDINIETIYLFANTQMSKQRKAHAEIDDRWRWYGRRGDFNGNQRTKEI